MLGVDVIRYGASSTYSEGQIITLSSESCPRAARFNLCPRRGCGKRW